MLPRPVIYNIGAIIGKLTVINRLPKSATRKTIVCRCECGTVCSKYPSQLVSGKGLHCGCINLRIKHGECYKKISKFYRLWGSMMRRCYSPKTKHFDRYGGRGITVCNTWHDFKNFKADVKPLYVEGLSIDRVDNDKGYFKENIRFVPLTEQQNNKSNNLRITQDGVTMIASEWARKLGINKSTVRRRFDKYGRVSI